MAIIKWIGRRLVYCVILVLSGVSPAWCQNAIFLTPAEALQRIFKDSAEVYKQDFQVTPQMQKQAQKLLGYELPRSVYSFYLGKSGGKVDGYALIDEEVGKVLPITFITRISPQGKVEVVEIMVYRESRGGEVQDKRFLNQFKNKSLQDEIRLHGDIINITGATLSSRALVVGVKRALVLWQIFYGEPAPLSSKQNS